MVLSQTRKSAKPGEQQGYARTLAEVAHRAGENASGLLRYVRGDVDGTHLHVDVGPARAPQRPLGASARAVCCAGRAAQQHRPTPNIQSTTTTTAPTRSPNIVAHTLAGHWTSSARS